MILGADISSYQGSNIDFNTLKTKVSFVLIRGVFGMVQDKTCIANANKAVSAGLRHGMYHVIVPTTTAKMSNQVSAFKKVMLQSHSTFRCAVDVEVSGVGGQLLKDFCEAIEDEIGMVPIIYTRQSFWDGLAKNSSIGVDWAAKYPLWVASYKLDPTLTPAMPSRPWKDWSIWQYSDRGPGEEYGLKPYEASVIDLNVVKDEYVFANLAFDSLTTDSLPPLPSKVEVTAQHYFGRSAPEYVDETKALALLAGTTVTPTGNQEIDPISGIVWMEVELPEELRKVWISRNSNYIKEIN